MKIGRQIIVSTVIRFLIFLLAFVSVKILTNTLSVSDYGIYSLIFTTIAILSLILDFGLHKYLFVKVPGEKKTKGFSFFTSVFIFELIALLIFAILIVGIGIPLINYYNWEISLKILILSTLLLIFGILVNETVRFHTIRRRIELSSIINFFRQKSWVLLLLFIWWRTWKININQILLIRLIPLILLLFISFWLMKKKNERLGNNKIFNKNFIQKGLIFGTPLIIMGFGYHLLISADRYIITSLISTEAVGYYSFVYALVTTAYGLSSSLSGAFYFHFSEAYNLAKRDNSSFSRAQDMFNCSFKFALIGGLFLGIIFALLRHPLIPLFSKKEYLVAAPTMLILASFPVLLSTSNLFEHLLLLEKERKALIKAFISAPLLNVVLNFILIPKFGINGAAIATVASYLFIFLFFLLKIKKYHVLKFTEINFLKLASCLLLAIIPLYFFRPNSILELFYSGITSAIIYLISLFAFKVITKKDWAILWTPKKQY